MTGSTAGIGAEIARVLAAEGAVVIIHGRNTERAEKFAAELRAAGGAVAITLGELTSDDEAERVARDLTAFLASPSADAITGSDFIVDGGLGITGFNRQPSQPPKSGAGGEAAPTTLNT